MQLKLIAICAFVLLFSFQQSIGQTSSPVIITEINYNSDSTMNSGNWLELYNKSTSTVDLSGWKIKNALAVTYTIPSGTQLNASAYLVVFQDQAKFTAINPGIANKIGPSAVDFDNTLDNIQLLDASNAPMVNVSYADTGVWPHGADGYGRTLELNNYNGDLTNGANWFDGCMFGSPGVAYSPCNPDIVFSEINYNSSPTADAGDWVELHNTTSSSINLNGYTLKDSKDSNIYFIPNGITLGANGYRVFCNDVGKFLTRHPGITNVNGPFTFGFKSKGEAIRLFGADGKIKFSVLYDNKSPWQTTPDSGGYTLELMDIHGKMDNAENWFAGCPEGSPGMVYDPFCLNGVSTVTNSDFNFSISNSEMNLLTVTVSGIDKSTVTEISFVNLLGQKIFQGTVANGINQLNISTLNAGLYLAEINSNGELHSMKFIKN